MVQCLCCENWKDVENLQYAKLQRILNNLEFTKKQRKRSLCLGRNEDKNNIFWNLEQKGRSEDLRHSLNCMLNFNNWKQYPKDY